MQHACHVHKLTCSTSSMCTNMQHTRHANVHEHAAYAACAPHVHSVCAASEQHFHKRATLQTCSQARNMSSMRTNVQRAQHAHEHAACTMHCTLHVRLDMMHAWCMVHVRRCIMICRGCYLPHVTRCMLRFMCCMAMVHVASHAVRTACCMSCAA